MIGPSGSKIKQLIEENGGKEKVKVMFPKNTVSGDMNSINITAPASSLEIIKASLQKVALSRVLGKGSNFKLLLAESDCNVVTESLVVPKIDSKIVFGKNYEHLIDMMKRFGVTIWLSSDKDSIAVKIVAAEAQVNEFKKCLAAMKVLIIKYRVE